MSQSTSFWEEIILKSAFTNSTDFMLFKKNLQKYSANC